jgi:hypothetical protein
MFFIDLICDFSMAYAASITTGEPKGYATLSPRIANFI